MILGSQLFAENTNTLLEEVNVSETAQNGTAENGYVVKETTGIGLWDKRSLQDTPYQMSIVSQDMIENTASGIDQIFKMNPVVQVTRTSTSSHSWNTPEINIRGFSASGNHILDGIPFSWVEGVTTEELETIEVLNGLSGFLYGVGYVGGAVNYVTKKPTLEDKRTIKVGRWRDKWKKNPRRFRLFLKFKLLIKSPGHISDNHIACGIAEIPLSLYSIA